MIKPANTKASLKSPTTRRARQPKSSLPRDSAPKNSSRLKDSSRLKNPSRSKKSPAQKALLDEKRQEILDVAVRLFHEQGYAGTTMEMITDALGVSKPYVYYYFRSKQDIFETLCWRPTEACFTALDFPPDDKRPAHEKLAEGLERLLAETILHYPASFFAYLYPRSFRPATTVAIRKLARSFYDKMCVLLEEARRDGTADVDCVKITALAACSIPGFLYTWYRPDGRLTADAVVGQLAPLMYRVIGLRLTESPATQPQGKKTPRTI